MNYIDGFILSFFDMFMIIYIVISINNKLDKHHILQATVGIIVGTIICSSGYYIEYQIVSLTINIIIGLLIIMYILKLSIKETIVTYVYGLTLLYSLQLLATAAVWISVKDFEYSFINGVVVQLITTALVIFGVRILPIRRLYLLIINKNKWFGVLAINIFVVYYVMMILWYINISGFLENMIGVLLLVVLILLINTIMITHGFKNQIMAEKMKMYDIYFPVIESVIEEIRSKQHDYHNHLLALKTLNNNNPIFPEYEDYMQRITIDEIWSKLIKLDNKILMAFLYSKFIYAQDNNVTINYEISNYLFSSKMQNYDLIEMFGILIDNAIEATLISNTKLLNVILGFDHGINIIETRNKSLKMSSRLLQDMFNDNYKTDTTQKHGYGLKKLKRLISEYNGTILVHNDTILVHNDTAENEIIFRVEIPTLLE